MNIILDICSEPRVLEVMKLINIFITIIKIVVPILLIFTLMLKFGKAVINDDKDNLQSALKSAPKNIIAAVVIFLIPSFVAMIVRITFPENDYDKCITVRTAEEIQQVYSDREAKLISKTKEAIDKGDTKRANSYYNNAINYLNNIKDEDIKKIYKEELGELKEKIDETNEPVNNENPKIDRSIIYLGDSRTHDYIRKKSILGLDETKEFVFAKDGTGLDEDFRSQLSSARDKMKKYNTVSYAVTVNYGVNTLKRYEGFCNYYVDFVNKIDAKNDFYIISVNPVDTKKMKSGSVSHSNENIEIFNNYMKNTCVDRIKENSPDHNVYYCDIYNTLTSQEWIDKGYIKDDGLHYTEEGYKYIYGQTKACIAQHN